MSPTGTSRKNNAARAARRLGFSLIELILVMAILSIVMVGTAMSLSRFFQGQELRDEANRFLALARYAQSQAVSSGVPAQIWIDLTGKQYGVRPVPGYELLQDEMLAFKMDLRISVVPYPASAVDSKFLYMNFLPDGTVNNNGLRLLQFNWTPQGSNVIQDQIQIAKSLFGNELKVVKEGDVELAYAYQAQNAF